MHPVCSIGYWRTRTDDVMTRDVRLISIVIIVQRGSRNLCNLVVNICLVVSIDKEVLCHIFIHQQTIELSRQVKGRSVEYLLCLLIQQACIRYEACIFFITLACEVNSCCACIVNVGVNLVGCTRGIEVEALVHH